jgi:hypothetical protein
MESKSSRIRILNDCLRKTLSFSPKAGNNSSINFRNDTTKGCPSVQSPIVRQFCKRSLFQAINNQ